MRLTRYLAAGTFLFLWLTNASAQEAGGTKAKVKGKSKPAETAACGEHGTSLQFEESPSAAAIKARKEEKLVMVLHISGYFEDPAFT